MVLPYKYEQKLLGLTMNTYGSKLKTACSLGIFNIARVLTYRLKKKLGVGLVCYPHTKSTEGPFFKKIDKLKSKILDLQVTKNWLQDALYFGWYVTTVSEDPPDWHFNAFTNEHVDAVNPWWKISDFDSSAGDIKFVFEPSRFSWVLIFSQRVLLGDNTALTRLNHWLEDWCKKNPPYFGANWKCGQEAAIRVMHVAMAATLLSQMNQPTQCMLEFLKLHLQRIALTVQYAVSQDNNHGVSEAAALFIGGSWMVHLGMSNGIRWQRQGRKLLESQIKRLISSDGSSSQYSVNYHRSILDTLCIVELWRRQLNLASFSAHYQLRAIEATRWLAALVATETGDVPTIGAYDGARLLPLTDSDDRDFRPSVQLAMVLFTGRRAYAKNGHWNHPLKWFEIPLPEASINEPGSQVFDDSGFAVLRSSQVMAVMHYPRFRFRPSQADLMHVDLWKDGENLLRDAGSYSYHTDQIWLNYFSGTASHNTIQFDDRDQMPRLSRFLFGGWIKTEDIEPMQVRKDGVSFAASYRDYKGAYHKRRLHLTNFELNVFDEIEGFSNKAILRWRLRPGQWLVEGAMVTNGSHRLLIDASMPIKRIELVTGWESRYYMHKTEVPVLEIEVPHAGIIHSVYKWTL